MELEITKAIGIVFFSITTVVLLALFFRILAADASEYHANRTRLPSLWASFTGEIPTAHDGQRDFRVAAGLAVDLRTGQWKEQGKLSDDAIDGVLKPHS